MPDVNGDGVDEVLVGGPSRKSRAPGKAELLSGQDGTSLFRWAAEEHGGEWGAAVAAWEDSEGQVYLAIGEPGAADGQGRVGLVSSSDLEQIRWIDGTASQTCFGFSLAAGRDMTGDEQADLVVGAPDLDGGGSVTLIDGTTGAARWSAVSDETGYFGYDVALAPDLDEDGLAEVLVGHAGVGAFVLSGADGTTLLKLGDATLGRYIGDSVTVLERPSSSPLLVVGSGGLPGHDDFAEDKEEGLPNPAIFVFDASTRALSVETKFPIDYDFHKITLGMRLRAVGDFDDDGHDDLAICQPNGYLAYGPTGRIDLRSGANDTNLGTTYFAGAGFSFPALELGADACSIRHDGERILIVSCPRDGGVAALKAGPKIGANQGRGRDLPQVWAHVDS